MNKIYYFSGTGNSLRAAMKIAKALGNTEIVAMRKDSLETDATNLSSISK